MDSWHPFPQLPVVTSTLYTEPMYPLFILVPFSGYSLDFIFFDLADPPLEKKSNPHEAGSDKVFTWWDWVASWSSNNIRFPLRFDEVLISSTCIKYRKVKWNYHYIIWFNNSPFNKLVSGAICSSCRIFKFQDFITF